MTDQWLKRIYKVLFLIGSFYFLTQEEFLFAILLLLFDLTTGIEDK